MAGWGAEAHLSTKYLREQRKSGGRRTSCCLVGDSPADLEESGRLRWGEDRVDRRRRFYSSHSEEIRRGQGATLSPTPPHHAGYWGHCSTLGWLQRALEAHFLFHLHLLTNLVILGGSSADQLGVWSCIKITEFHFNYDLCPVATCMSRAAQDQDQDLDVQSMLQVKGYRLLHVKYM